MFDLTCDMRTNCKPRTRVRLQTSSFRSPIPHNFRSCCCKSYIDSLVGSLTFTMCKALSVNALCCGNVGLPCPRVSYSQHNCVTLAGMMRTEKFVVIFNFSKR